MICPSYSTPFSCFPDLQALIAENTRPTAAGGYFCLICTKVIKGCFANAKYHFRDLHWSDAPSYWCFGKEPKCQKYYTSMSAFRMHLRNNHPDWKGVSLDTFVVKKWKNLDKWINIIDSLQRRSFIQERSKHSYFFSFFRPWGNNCWKYSANRWWGFWWVFLHYLRQGP